MNLKATPVRRLEEQSRRKEASRRKDASRSPAHSSLTRKEQQQFNPSLYIRPKFSEEDIISIKEVFDTYDSNNTGILSPNDLKVALFHHGFHATK